MSADNVLAAELAANLLTPAQLVTLAAKLLRRAALADEGLSYAAQLEVHLALRPLKRAAELVAVSEQLAALTPEQLRARCGAEADVEAGSDHEAREGD